jgi:hypothetical protein
MQAGRRMRMVQRGSSLFLASDGAVHGDTTQDRRHTDRTIPNRPAPH